MSERLSEIVGFAVTLEGWPRAGEPCFTTPSPLIHARGRAQHVVRALLEEIAEDDLSKTWRVVRIPRACTQPACRNPHHYYLDLIRLRDGTRPEPLPLRFATVLLAVSTMRDPTTSTASPATSLSRELKEMRDTIADTWAPEDRPPAAEIQATLEAIGFDADLDLIEAALAQIKKESDPFYEEPLLSEPVAGDHSHRDSPDGPPSSSSSP